MNRRTIRGLAAMTVPIGLICVAANVIMQSYFWTAIMIVVTAMNFNTAFLADDQAEEDDQSNS